MNIDELKELCKLTLELTKLRQKECPHLCIENFAPDLLEGLIRASVATRKDNPDAEIGRPNSQ